MADASARHDGVGWVRYVWLVYLAGIPLDLSAGHAAPWRWAVGLTAAGLFLPLYFAAFRCEGRRAGPLILAAMFAFGAGVMPFVDAALCFYIYGAAFAAFAFDRSSTAWRVLAGYVILAAVVMSAEREPPAMMLTALVFSLIIGAVNVRSAEMSRDAGRLRLAYAEVERLTTLAERERIARDLHDVLGHSLSVIALKSELASRLAGDAPARAAHEIREVERLARDALRDVRDAVAGYRSRGVAQEIEHAGALLRSAGLTVACDAAPVRLPAAQEGVLALAIREAVTNVVRHAGARAVTMRLARENGVCRFEIADDGRGTLGPEGFGLRGMRERVESLGGTLERRQDAGTRLIVTLPAPA